MLRVYRGAPEVYGGIRVQGVVRVGFGEGSTVEEGRERVK